MVSEASLAALAVAIAGPALLVARLRGIRARAAFGDAGAALCAALLTLVLACGLYAMSVPPGAAPEWRVAASLLLLATPVPAVAVLRMRGRRSIPRALLASSSALVGVVVWLVLHLKGAGGGWSAGEIAGTVGAASVAIAAAACLGWWSRRAAGERA